MKKYLFLAMLMLISGQTCCTNTETEKKIEKIQQVRRIEKISKRYHSLSAQALHGLEIPAIVAAVTVIIAIDYYIHNIISD